jgi:hypothetical protein
MSTLKSSRELQPVEKTFKLITAILETYQKDSRFSAGLLKLMGRMEGDFKQLISDCETVTDRKNHYKKSAETYKKDIKAIINLEKL